MKKLLSMSLVVLGMAALSSCSSSRIVTSSAVDITPTVRPIIADLEVSNKKITGTFSSEDKRVFKWGRAGEDEIIRNAVFQALQEQKADVLIGLQYQITEVRSPFGHLKEKIVVITGYPAYYRNIRQMPNTEVNTIELKPDTPYVVTEKDGNGDSKVYTIITTPSDKLVLDLNQSDVDSIGLKRGTK